MRYIITAIVALVAVQVIPISYVAGAGQYALLAWSIGHFAAILALGGIAGQWAAMNEIREEKRRWQQAELDMSFDRDYCAL